MLTAGTQQLELRLAEDADFPALARLWRDTAGWGDITREEWRAMFAHPEHGTGFSVVATHDERVVAHVGFLASRVSVDGAAVAAARVYAAIVDEGFRSDVRDTDKHAFWQIYRWSVAELEARGVGVVYALADPRWRQAARERSPFRRAWFRQWRAALPLAAAPTLPSGYTAQAYEWDGSLDALWARVAPRLGCAVVRDEAALRVRAERNAGVVTSVRRDGELVAVTLAREKQIDGWMSQWQIADVVATDTETYSFALAAAVAVAHEASVARGPRGNEQRELKAIERATTFEPPSPTADLAALGFELDKWKVPLTVHALDPELEAAVDPARWYISITD